MSELSVGQLKGLTVNNNVITVPAGHTIYAPGSVVQVITASKTDTFAGTPGAVWMDISGLSVTITPRFANSRFLVMADIKAAGTQDNSVVRSKIVRGISGTFADVGVGDAASNRPRSLGQFYIASGGGGLYYLAQIGGNISDQPNTLLPVTYKAQIGADSNSVVVRVNITQGDRDAAYQDARGHSSITVMEIAQ
jgi:hypothetical protein